MYKLLKDKGNNSNVILEKTSTKECIIIGKLSMEILKLLEDKEGLVFDKDKSEALDLRTSWILDISEDTAKALSKMTMKMKKPIRDQKKKPSEQPSEKNNKKIDALDVLLGLASYN